MSKKVTKFSPTLSPETVRELFGPPPVPCGEDAGTHHKIFKFFSETIKPQDAIEWMLVEDLAFHRIQTVWLRRLKAKIIEHQRERESLATQQSYFSIRVSAADLQRQHELKSKIEKLTGEPDKIKAEAEKLVAAEAPEKIAAEIKQILEETWAIGDTRYRHDEAAVFDKWIANFGLVDGLLDAEQARFQAALEQLDDHRHGLGARLKAALDAVIDGEFEPIPPSSAPSPSTQSTLPTETAVSAPISPAAVQPAPETMRVPEPAQSPPAAPADSESEIIINGEAQSVSPPSQGGPGVQDMLPADAVVPTADTVVPTADTVVPTDAVMPMAATAPPTLVEPPLSPPQAGAQSASPPVMAAELAQHADSPTG
jgi:hypothetical protein